MKLIFPFYSLVFLYVFYACETKTEPVSSKVESNAIQKKSSDKKVENERTDNSLQKLNESSNQIISESAKPSKIASKPLEQKTKVSKQNFTTTQQKEVKKPAIPTKWKNTYSQDKKWLDLYESSRTYFLNGWNSEFERNPDASISRDELLLAYRKRMENIFYETPTFIEFCVQEMKVSAEFELFCQKWKENVR